MTLVHVVNILSSDEPGRVRVSCSCDVPCERAAYFARLSEETAVDVGTGIRIEESSTHAVLKPRPARGATRCGEAASLAVLLRDTIGLVMFRWTIERRGREVERTWRDEARKRHRYLRRHAELIVDPTPLERLRAAVLRVRRGLR